MARQYPVFALKTTFLAVLLTAFIAFIPAAQAADDLYTVSGVRVDATSTSAVAARKQAFEQAQQAAFALLASRFLSPEQMKTFQAPPVDQLTPTVDDFEITNEQLSAVRYVGTYTFRFRHNAAHELIAARGAMANEAAYTSAAATPPTPGAAPAPHAATNYDGAYSPYAASAPPPYATASPAISTGSIRVRVRYSNMAQWTQIQRSLRAVSNVTDLRVLTLTPAEAIVAVDYQGTETALRQSLGQAGMVLNPSGGTATNAAMNQAYNPYAAALSATAPGAGDTVYDLGAGYYAPAATQGTIQAAPQTVPAYR